MLDIGDLLKSDADVLTGVVVAGSVDVDSNTTTLTFTKEEAVIQTIVLENYAPADVDVMLTALRDSGSYNSGI